MHFVKIGQRFLNLDVVAYIEEDADTKAVTVVFLEINEAAEDGTVNRSGEFSVEFTDDEAKWFVSYLNRKSEKIT